MLSNQISTYLYSVTWSRTTTSRVVKFQTGRGTTPFLPNHMTLVFSSKANRHQLNYFFSVKKTLAMSLTQQHFEISEGSSTQEALVYRDHDLLVSHRIYNSNQCLMRWALLAQKYSLEIFHNHAPKNVVADGLSPVL